MLPLCLFCILAGVALIKAVEAHQNALGYQPPAEILATNVNGIATLISTTLTTGQLAYMPPAILIKCNNAGVASDCAFASGIFTTVTANSYLTPIGAPVASATTITPTGEIFHITGTNTIATITLPSGYSSTVGGCLTVIADAAWATNTAGNIADVVNASPNTEYRACYDGSKFYIK